MARLARISQPVVGDVDAWEVPRPVEDGHLVGLGALVGTGQLFQQQDIHWPLGMAIQGRVPSLRFNILAEYKSLDISWKLDHRY